MALELETFREFRKHEGNRAFVEGWGLYAEGLGVELDFTKIRYSNLDG